MTNLAIVDVLLYTRSGRSLLNKLQIYISCAINSLEVTAHYKLNCIATLVSYLNHHKNIWYIMHKFQSTNMSTDSTTTLHNTLHTAPLFFHGTAWITNSDTEHNRRRRITPWCSVYLTCGVDCRTEAQII